MIGEATAFRRALHGWFRSNGRTLPWRSGADPYAVLVSEFMLQQTTVAAVKPYFARWMSRFPSFESLAASDEDDVLKLWEGLGYYSRARNLQRAARIVVGEFGGNLPSDPATLRSLPGVGPYTAAAVAAFAFDRCVPVIDANIQRVIARLIDFREPIQTAQARETIDQAAREILPSRGGRLHASALMDLGAMICRSGQPECSQCPMRRFCRAKDPVAIPRKPPRAEIVHESETRAFAFSRGQIFLVPSPGPRWRGLWILPEGQTFGIPLASFEYAVTRHRIRLNVFEARRDASWTGFPLASLPAMPSPHRKAVETALDSLRRRSTLPE